MDVLEYNSFCEHQYKEDFLKDFPESMQIFEQENLLLFDHDDIKQKCYIIQKEYQLLLDEIPVDQS